jgi:hypothetical protein
LGEFGRAALIALTSTTLAVLASWLVLSRFLTRYYAVAAGLVIAVGAWWTLHFLDGRPKANALEYAAVPLAGAIIAMAFRFIPTGLSIDRARAWILRRSYDS